MYLSARVEVSNLLRKDGREFALCESPSLRHRRLVCLDKNSKRDELEALANTPAFYPKKPYEITANEHSTIVCYAKLKTPLIINQVGGILENAGLSLHRNFGFPIVPGSALKGIASHAGWRLWYNAEGDEKLKMAALMVSIFGYPTNHNNKMDKNANLDAYIATHAKELGLPIDGKTSQPKAMAGGVGFMAAEPYYENDAPEKRMLLLDVTTSHHMHYYSQASKGDNVEAYDTEKPNPQFFIAIKPGAEFRFVLRRLNRDLLDEHFKYAAQLLMAALEVLGAGAKTAAGYGYFEDRTEIKHEKQQKEIGRRLLEKKRKDALQELIKIEQLAGDERAKALFTFKEAYGTLINKDENQQIYETYHRLLPKVELTPKEIILDRWEKNKNIKSILNGNDIKGFDKKKPEEKIAIVDLLRTENELCKAIWAEVKNPKNRLSNVEQLIRKFAKDQGWGKMK